MQQWLRSKLTMQPYVVAAFCHLLTFNCPLRCGSTAIPPVPWMAGNDRRPKLDPFLLHSAPSPVFQLEHTLQHSRIVHRFAFLLNICLSTWSNCNALLEVLCGQILIENYMPSLFCFLATRESFLGCPCVLFCLESFWKRNPFVAICSARFWRVFPSSFSGILSRHNCVELFVSCLFFIYER